jgi:hypothetical protein
LEVAGGGGSHKGAGKVGGCDMSEACVWGAGGQDNHVD